LLLAAGVPGAFAATRPSPAPPVAPTPPCCPAEKGSGGSAPCCPAEAAPAAKTAAPCCADAGAGAPLSARSLYQLEAQWTDDAGRAVSLASLRGRPVVLAMIFASCEYACPVLIDDLKRLRTALPEPSRDQARVVLVSFDPARDTPEALAAFRVRLGLGATWTLLRGAESPVQELAMLLGVKFKQDARGQFAHSNLFTVLNAEGEVVHQHAGLLGDISPAAKVVASLLP
jgi:protein SCO1/2